MNNTTNTLPKELNALDVGPDSEYVSNMFTGERCFLPPVAVAIYDFIIGAQLISHTEMFDSKVRKEMQIGLNWFKKHYPREYMTLLD